MADWAQAETHVLILCEQQPQCGMFDRLFDISGLHAVTATNEDDFTQRLDQQRVDVILLAAQMPDLQMFELLNRIKQFDFTHREIPVVMVFDRETPTEVALHALHLGAYDYLIEPFNEIELLTKVTVLAKIKHAEDEFRALAIRDKLTGLYDRRYLFIRFHEELSRAKRYSRPISCICLDVDAFRKYNEDFGVEAADHLLSTLAETMNRSRREIDVLARDANDKFVFVLYNTDATGAMVLANRLHTKIRETELPSSPDFTVNVSMGISAIEATPELTMHAQELQQRAELALERAKREGGDRIVIYTDEFASDILPPKG